MKQNLFLCAILVMALALPQSVRAYDFSLLYSSTIRLYFNIVDDGVELTYPSGESTSPYIGYTNPYGALVIPDSVTYDGIKYAVISIGEYAFYGCSGLTSVTIGSNIISIGTSAFRYCTGLSFTSYSGTIAQWCAISFGDDVYSNPTWYTHGVKIGGSAITNLIIPDTVTSIGKYAFCSCTGLTSVTIPASVTSIGGDAFFGCSGLTSTIYNGTIAQWCSISFGSNPLSYSHSLTIGGEEVTNLVIPDSVTSIGDYAFCGCSSLTSITIPNSVTTIGDDAFYGCSGLTSITIPNSVTTIGKEAFLGCSGLTSITIPSSVTTISGSAFYNCSGLTSATIGNGVTTIGNDAFGGCSGLTSITIPSSVTTIGERAFEGCSGLTSITIPNSVTTIYSDAFRNCSGLTSATIGSGVTTIGTSAFSGCSGLTSTIYNGTIAQWCGISFHNWLSNPVYYSRSLTIGGEEVTNIVIPDSVTSIGDYAFQYCHSLTSVIIPDAVTYIGNSAFHYCRSLTSVTIPDAVTSIGDNAFSGCSSLASVIIGNGVTTIGYQAFAYCDSLTSIIIGSAVTYIGSAAFSDCHNLIYITCKAVYPPTLQSSYYFFWSLPSDCVLTVPCGSLTYYNESDWNEINYINEDCPPEYTVAVVSADPTMGTVSGGGQVLEGDEITITATANTGYRFVRWNDNDTNAVRTATITSDSTFTAYFEVLPDEGNEDNGGNEDNEGIDDADDQSIKVYAADGRLYIDAVQPVEATVYDMMGRRMATLAAGTSTSMPTGVYLVKVDTLPARKVVVLR